MITLFFQKLSAKFSNFMVAEIENIFKIYLEEHSEY